MIDRRGQINNNHAHDRLWVLKKNDNCRPPVALLWLPSTMHCPAIQTDLTHIPNDVAVCFDAKQLHATVSDLGLLV
jgi:hypothetical protein